jgi:hypothetical protein
MLSVCGSRLLSQVSQEGILTSPFFLHFIS